MSENFDQSGLNRRAFLWTTVGAAGVVALGSPAMEAEAAAIPQLVQGGRARSVIIHSPQADAQVRFAAETLAKYVAKSTGVVLPIRSSVDGIPADLLRVYVGFGGPGAHPQLPQALAGMDPDGTISALYQNTFTIMGPTSWSTRYAVNQFLEDGLGVYWLMPTEAGEEFRLVSGLPAQTGIKISNPTFGARTMYPAPPSQQSSWELPATPLRQWGDDNRSHWRMHFHHNLHVIFDSSKFGATHPEYYPIINGTAKIPGPGAVSGWNPRFSEPGTVDVAAAAAIEFFRAHPDAPSFSFGVTDGGGFSEDEVASAGTNSVGMADMSPIYWGWVNQVVEKVIATDPRYAGKWFGGLAYHEVQDPPPFKLHPRVVPYLTYERYHWIVPELKEQDLATTRAWLNAASQLGWYDYMWGNPYSVPRPVLGLWDEVLNTAADNSVIGIMTELVHSWGEGAKPWALARKMWDSTRSLVTEADRWYELAVGKAAAGFLREYFQHWENFWMTRVPNTLWFEAGRHHTWFPFDTMGYLDAVTPADITKSRGLLETARSKTRTPRERQRADALLKAFNYYEASALSYPREPGVPADADAAMAMIADLVATIDTSVAMANRRLPAWSALQADPLHAQDGWASYEALGAAWRGYNTKAMIRISDFVRSDASGADRVAAEVDRLIADPASSSDLRWWAQHCRYMINGDKASYGVNLGFEDGLTGWVLASNPTVLRDPAGVSTDFSLEGKQSLRLGSGFQTMSINQGSAVFPVVDGVWVQEVRYHVPAGKEAHGVFVPGILAFDAAGTQLGYRQDYYVPMSYGQQEGWAVCRYSERLPVGTATVRTINVAAYMGPGEVYIDDVRFELFADPGSIQLLDHDRMYLWPDGTEVVADPLAHGGTAVRMPGDRLTQYVHLNLSELPAEGEWRVHVLVRIDTTPEVDRAAVAVQIGSYPNGGLAKQSFPVSKFIDGNYQLLTYQGTYRHEPDRYLHVSGLSAGVPYVYVDRFFLTKV